MVRPIAEHMSLQICTRAVVHTCLLNRVCFQLNHSPCAAHVGTCLAMVQPLALWEGVLCCLSLTTCLTCER